jgi:hypothetical protein
MRGELLLGSLLAGLLGGLVSFVFWYVYAKVELGKAILIASVMAISLFTGGFIGAKLFYTR